MQKYFEVTTSDKSILKQDILRMIIQRQAEEMLVGKNASVLMDIGSLDIKFNLPNAIYFEMDEIAEGTKGPSKILEWFDIGTSLKKYENKMTITHEVKARQLQKQQVNLSIDRCARGQAYTIDKEIFTTLKAAAGNNAAASAQWDAATPDPARDVADAIGKILDTTTILDTDIPNIGIYYPAKLWGHLSRQTAIYNVQTTLRSFMEKEYQVSFHPTRQLTTEALVVLKSTETVLTLTYNGDALPLSFFETDSSGEKYTFHRYFRSVVIPDVEGGSTTNRIFKITGVTA